MGLKITQLCSYELRERGVRFKRLEPKNTGKISTQSCVITWYTVTCGQFFIRQKNLISVICGEISRHQSIDCCGLTFFPHPLSHPLRFLECYSKSPSDVWSQMIAGSLTCLVRPVWILNSLRFSPDWNIHDSLPQYTVEHCY